MENIRTLLENTQLAPEHLNSYTLPFTQETLLRKEALLIEAASLLEKQANEYLQKHDFTNAKIATILSHPLQAHLNNTEEFNPYTANPNSRRGPTALTSLSESETRTILALIEKNKLPSLISCRLLDFCWTCSKAKSFQILDRLLEHTLRLIQPARGQSLNGYEISSCLFRAIFLLIRAKRTDAVREVTTKSTSLLQSCGHSDRFFPLFIAQALRKNRIYYDNAAVTKELERLSNEHFSQDHPISSEIAFRFLQEAQQHISNDNQSETNRLLQKAAEIQESLGNVQASAIRRNHHWQQAIQKLRAIPKESRNAQMQKQLREIEAKIQATHIYEREELECMSASADFSDCVRHYESSISGKSKIEAFRYFIECNLPISLEVLETEARDTAQRNLCYRFASTELRDEFGNSVKSVPCYSSAKDNKELFCHIKTENLNTYCSTFALVKILPQLRLLNNEHSFPLQFFRDAVQASEFVPMSRKEEFSRALYYGMNEDFFGAIHLLSPLLEHTCRMITKELLKRPTITRDAQGYESELSLNGLIQIRELREFLSEPIAFYIEAIFCRPDGGNLRNKVAHGLISTATCLNPIVPFAWWFLLRFAILAKIKNTNKPAS